MFLALLQAIEQVVDLQCLGRGQAETLAQCHTKLCKLVDPQCLGRSQAE